MGRREALEVLPWRGAIATQGMLLSGAESSGGNLSP